MKKVTSRKWWIIGATDILALAAIASAWFLYIGRDIEFDPERWPAATTAEDVELRSRMVDDLLASRNLEGLPLSQIVALLGEPDLRDEYRNRAAYLVEYGWSITGIDPRYYLVFQLNQSHVVESVRVERG